MVICNSNIQYIDSKYAILFDYQKIEMLVYLIYLARVNFIVLCIVGGFLVSFV